VHINPLKTKIDLHCI